MYDLMIAGGTVVDGTGQAARTADVAVRDGTVAAVGRGLGRARRTIEADGAVVAPGWQTAPAVWGPAPVWGSPAWGNPAWGRPPGWYGGGWYRSGWYGAPRGGWYVSGRGPRGRRVGWYRRW